MTNSILPITCAIVVHNQASLLEVAIKSVYHLVGEIVVVHDGPCVDNSIAVAKKYGCRVFTRKHSGHSEKNRSFSYRKATYKWILQLDADEYLRISKKTLFNLIKSVEIATYGFRWEFQINKKSIYFGHKTALFHLDRISFIGSIHQIATRVDGFKHINTNHVLYHRANYHHSSFSDMKKNCHAGR